jgi:hypothetical protein
MEELPPHTDSLDSEEVTSSNADHPETSSSQLQEQEDALVAPQPAAAVDGSSTDSPVIATELGEQAGGAAQQITPATEAPEQTPSTSESPAVVAETDSSTPTTDPDPPPPAPPVVEEPQIQVPEWVTYPEDKTEITEEELKNIEGTDVDTSALDVQHFEQKIYVGVDDPEQRPVKKMRLSWTIKGVRGTTERPNYARVMNSPAACVDGFYWYIKFFPRGNNASHLSTYIKCTPVPPKPDSDVPENTFKVFHGPPDANLGDVEPVIELSIPATAAKKEESTPADSTEEVGADSKKPAEEVATDTSTASAVESAGTTGTHEQVEVDWRISAEIGTVIYNPTEPRTNSMSRSEHQFNKHNDDWGWTNFHGPWNTIHVREKDQRKPLLQNDTLTIDAYIQIYEDPTQSLWWHPAEESEKRWDAKSLTGYFPFGTPKLYHSPGVAGLSSLLLLKPFRDILQSIDTGRWRKDAKVKPQPLISQLQIVLFLMRQMKKEVEFVDLNPILETLDSYGETFSTVRKFWEILRRSIELELEDNKDAVDKFADIFDGTEVPEASSVTLTEALKIPVEGVEDVQQGIERSLASLEGNRTFPKFLPVELDRDKFDKSTREWKLLHNRVKLNNTIDLSRFATEKVPSNYTLYGFAIHVGERISSKAYTVLRPNGPGTKWLAFEDGEGNKIYSYTNKRVQDFEGLEGEALSSFRSTRQTAYLAMYIRTDCLEDFLPGPLEPYEEPDFDWIRAHLVSHGPVFNGETKPTRSEADNGAHKTMAVEVYDAAKIKGRRGLLDMYNLRQPSGHLQNFTLPATTTYAQLRCMIAESMKIEDVETIRFWAMEYGPLGEFVMATMPRPKLEYPLAGRKHKDYKPLCLWLEVLQNEEDVKRYGIADPPEPEKLKVDQTGLFVASLGASEESSADNDGALNLLFPETQGDAPEATLGSTEDNANLPEDDAGLPQDTPAGTASTPSSGVTDDGIDLVAHPDQVQASVAVAVDATVAAMPDSVPNTVDSPVTLDVDSSTSDVMATFDFDTLLFAPLNETAPPTALVVPVTIENERPTDASVVPDAQDPVAALDIEDADAAIIAQIIAAEIEAVDSAHEQTTPVISPETQSESIIVQPTDEAQAYTPDPSVATTIPEPVHVEEPVAPQSRDIPHIYGFLQLFKVDEQDFEVHSTFFAPYEADVKETVRKALDYADDREFSVWQREKSCKTCTVNKGDTFEKINFRDGVDLIVGDPLSKEQKDRFLMEGKFVTPASLSNYLWMKQRRHPVKAFTGTKTLGTFGRDYYAGPLLNGRFHGDKGTYITSTGHTYVGPFVSGVRQGQTGTLTYQNGDCYTGGFRADEKHGQGTFVQKRTGNKYVGGYQNDKRWGKGTMFYEVADEEGEMCQICYGEEMDALFYDCGHVCACVECAKQVEVCPICRKAVKDVVRVFRA